MKPVCALGLSVLSGLLLIASFAPLSWDWLVWVALVPLFVVVRYAGVRGAVGYAGVTGFLFHLVQNRWIYVTVWDNRDWLPYGDTRALLIALIAWNGAALVLAGSVAMVGGIVSFATSRLPGLYGFWLAAPAWCLGEYLRSLGPLAHVWANLGYCLSHRISVIQSADVGGVYLTAFLVAATNAAAAGLGVAWRERRKGAADTFPPEAGVLALLVAGAHLANLGYGAVRLHTLPYQSSPRFLATAVQQSASVAEKVDAQSLAALLTRHEAATRTVPRSDLVVWPETALPTVVKQGDALSRRLAALARTTGKFLVVGALAEDEAGRSYNAALVYAPRRGLIGRYYKRHLVPFGERVPFQRRLPFLRAFRAREPEFTPGGAFKPVTTRLARLGICICFESMFPSITRQLVAQGAQVLVILTNDEWYHRTFAPEEHAEMAVFRAVETRRDVIRAANTGITCFVDATGRVLGRTRMDERTTLTHSVRVHDGKTLYVRLGDWLPLLSLFALVAGLATPLWIRRQTHLRRLTAGPVFRCTSASLRREHVQRLESRTVSQQNKRRLSRPPR